MDADSVRTIEPMFNEKRMLATVRSLAALFLVCATATLAHAQGVQTGTIRGVVHDEQGLAVPGVTVTVTSPALQGVAHRGHRFDRRLHDAEPAAGRLYRHL